MKSYPGVGYVDGYRVKPLLAKGRSGRWYCGYKFPFTSITPIGKGSCPEEAYHEFVSNLPLRCYTPPEHI